MSQPLSKTQQALLNLMRDGYEVWPSEYHGRFGTSAAKASKKVGDRYEHARISQATVDALYRRGLVRYVGQFRNKRVVLAEHALTE